MSFKKKQLVGFGMVFILILGLIGSTLFMIKTMKSNMLEIVEDRYYKVNLVTEIRQLFYQIDRESLIVRNQPDTTEAKKSQSILKQNHQQIRNNFYKLEPILNRTKSKNLLAEIQANHSAYLEAEKQILNGIKNRKKIETVLESQRQIRSDLLTNLNDFKVYQEYLMKDALKSANQTYQDVLNLLTFSVILAVLAIVLIAVWVIKTTTESLRNIIEVMKKVNYEDLTSLPRVEVKTNDEIGEIASTFNEMAHSLESYSMKEKQFTTKIEDQNWVQTRLAELATMYQHIEDLEILGTRFMSKLAPIMNASFGAFYFKKGEGRLETFHKLASFAENEKDAGRRSFRPGEGLIGQIAIEKKLHFIEDIPDDFRLITSGLGEVKPKSILIAPVLFEGETVAMIELASMEQFSEIQRLFILQALDTLGITINSIHGRMEIERLLKESQAQSEELQVQSEELQTQSEELQAQAEEMQSQSEELRMINEKLEERNRDAELKRQELEKAKLHLEKQAAQLKLSSKYKSEFLANMSHELRTPLNSILILSDMLSDTDEKSLSSEQQEFARVIHSSGQDLLSLINDILDLSKVEVGKLDIVFGEMNLSELPGLLERNFSHLAKKKGIDFIIEKDKNVPEIFYTDEQRLQQILKNMLSNAFKFTEGGSVKVKISHPPFASIKEKVSFSTEQSWLEIVVEDTGIGIPSDKLSLIFEAFHQVDGATMRKYGGTGLGLSICKEFSRLLGGAIYVESNEGKGSTFSLFIPNLPSGLSNHEDMIIAPQEVAATILDSDTNEGIQAENLINTNEKSLLNHSSGNLLKNKKVLVVDDDYRNIYALKHALVKEGMEILTAQDGRECLNILQKTDEIDIILMDIMMPGMDGYETMRRIRMIPQFLELPIVALTAKAMKGDKEKCLLAGASDYISKPLNLDQLLSVLRVWLSDQVRRHQE